MNYRIRSIKKEEHELLNDFLYEAIFIPEGEIPFPRSIIYKPEMQVYVKDFGTCSDDLCFVAEIKGKIIGAVWVRVMDDYGHIEDGVPSLAVSLYKEYRGNGIGSALMKRMLEEVKERGYKKVSLSCQKANYAVRMYKELGFEVLEDKEDEYIMVWQA